MDKQADRQKQMHVTLLLVPVTNNSMQYLHKATQGHSQVPTQQRFQKYKGTL